jgi:beta-lactamase regulating signal transducer with metallopeptidase domain
MELFLVSNFLVTSLALLYNHYSSVNISAKLILSSFALSCWLVPFSAFRSYVPQALVIKIGWFSQKPSAVVSDYRTFNPTLLEQLNLFHLFLLLSLIGILLFCMRRYRFESWLNNLKKNSTMKASRYHQSIPVYVSNKIDNALLIGYRHPQIWIHPDIANSDHLDVVLQHELTHFKHKDNYWLLLLEIVSAIYWWNFLLLRLVRDIKQAIESRCDNKASQNFDDGVYKSKLASLMLEKLPTSDVGWASAVVSKNSNIKRLKLLKEKQPMNRLNKSVFATVLFICASIIVVPISSLHAKDLPEPDDIGILLSLKIDISSQIGQAVRTVEAEMQIWVKPEELATIKLSEAFEADMTAKFGPNETILIQSEFFAVSKTQPLCTESA